MASHTAAPAKGNDQVRFELAYKAIAPNVQIIAPWREWDIDSREDAIAYAEKHNVPIEQSKKNIYSRDRNIWHLSHEGAELEDPANSPNEAMWQWVVSPDKAPDKAEEVEIGFEAGTPVSVNGTKLGPVDLLNKLNEIAARNGIGRTDLVENRLVGMKSRGAYETPGGTLLIKAHQELERLTVDRETAHFQQALSHRYAELVYNGVWFSTLRESLDGFFKVAQQFVTGTVGLKFWKGTLNVTRRKSPFSFYRADLASFTMGRYNPKDAEGFINLFAFPVTVRPKAKAEGGKELHRGDPTRLRRSQDRTLTIHHDMTHDRTQRRPTLGRPLRARTETRFDAFPALASPSIGACCPTNSPSIARGRERCRRSESSPKSKFATRSKRSTRSRRNCRTIRHFSMARPPKTCTTSLKARLVHELGALGWKLHTGRSRNELVATDFRLFVMDAAASLAAATRAVSYRACRTGAKHNFGMPMAGMTHMQHAQPILLSHFLLAHAEAFSRDVTRLQHAAESADACPMGSGALAGNSFGIDRDAIARDLGFSRITANSLDAVSDRDFALDYLLALTGIATHLSRLAEDFVIFASQEFAYRHSARRIFATGSSLMPQKKNPDAWELIRGKTGRVTGALIALLTTMKGLPTELSTRLAGR